MKPINPEIGDVTMPLNCFDKHHHDHSGVVVIASAWLVLYGIVFSASAFTPAAEMLASLY
jgi:hypothetical protein